MFWIMEMPKYLSCSVLKQNRCPAQRTACPTTILWRIPLPAPAPFTTHQTTDWQRGSGHITLNTHKRSRRHYDGSAPTRLSVAPCVHTDEWRVRLNPHTHKFWLQKLFWWGFFFLPYNSKFNNRPRPSETGQGGFGGEQRFFLVSWRCHTVCSRGWSAHSRPTCRAVQKACEYFRLRRSNTWTCALFVCDLPLTSRSSRGRKLTARHWCCCEVMSLWSIWDWNWAQHWNCVITSRSWSRPNSRWRHSFLTGRHTHTHTQTCIALEGHTLEQCDSTWARDVAISEDTEVVLELHF